MRVLWALLSVVACTSSGCNLAVEADRLSEGCPPGTKACGNVCLSDVEPANGCGRASCSPCALGHSVAGCSAEGECVIASCVGSWEDCDREPSNGCEVNLEDDALHCGECGRVCEDPDRGEAACAQAACYVRACEQARADCNYDISDGCEVDLATDPLHCGECENSCRSGACSDSACEPI